MLIQSVIPGYSTEVFICNVETLLWNTLHLSVQIVVLTGYVNPFHNIVILSHQQWQFLKSLPSND